MFELYEKETNRLIGEIQDTDFEFLVSQLEEETETDEDYYLDRDTLDYLKENGMRPELSSLLEQVLGSREDVEIVFKKK